MSTSGDVMSTLGVFSTSGGYHDACVGIFMSTLGDVQYIGGCHEYIGDIQYIGGIS